MASQLEAMELQAPKSLPAPGQAPLVPHAPRAPHTIGAPHASSSPRTRKQQAARYLRPSHEGPILRVTVSEATFNKPGKFFLCFKTNGAEHSTAVSDDGYRAEYNQQLDFAIGENVGFDLELQVKAMQITVPRRQLPDLSPRGIMANLMQEAQGDGGSHTGGFGSQAAAATRGSEEVSRGEEKTLQEIGAARLTLADLLSTPQPAGANSKQHRLKLRCPGSSAAVGQVMLSWHMEDPQAEAREAAQRASERHKQAKAAAEAEARAKLECASRMAAERLRLLRASGALGEAEAEAAAAEASAAAARAADDFDRQVHESKWNEVLSLYSVMLWLPEGTVPQTIRLTARQAVGLSDAAARRATGRIAFVHSGLRVHLTPAVAQSLRAKVEAKMALSLEEMDYDSDEPILIATACPVSQRAVTAAGGATDPRSAAAAGGGGAGGSNEPADAAETVAAAVRHPTAPPRPRDQQPEHAASRSWLEAIRAPLEAAMLPARPSAPPARIGPNPKTQALMRASQLAKAMAAAEKGGEDGVATPRAPARVMPNPRRSAKLETSSSSDVSSDDSLTTHAK